MHGRQTTQTRPESLTKVDPYGEDFAVLSPTVAYCDASHAQVKPLSNCITQVPDLIVFTSWMDAAPKHVRVYLTKYRRLLPMSNVLLITTATRHILWDSEAHRLKDLQPAFEVLASAAEHAHSAEPSILLHAVSNGGATAAWLLLSTFRKRHGTALPLSKVCIDSAPGAQNYSSALAALSYGLPRNGVVRVVGLNLLRAFLALWFLYIYVSGSEGVIQEMRNGLNDESVTRKSAARLYIYSTADKLISWQDVESHADDAMKKGYHVRFCKYSDSAHAAHLLKDEKKYWDAITALWDGDA